MWRPVALEYNATTFTSNAWEQVSYFPRQPSTQPTVATQNFGLANRMARHATIRWSCSAVAVKDRQTLHANGQCDPNYDNKQLEWLVTATKTDPSGNRFVDKNEVLLYSIMVRLTDVHPKELPEFSWSTWWPDYLDK